jgi:CDP-ribitol ribitolphosphotransferase
MSPVHGSKRASIMKTIKTLVCKCLLSPLYSICALKLVKSNLVVLADGHRFDMPHSVMMVKMHLSEMPDLEVVEYYRDYSFVNPIKGIFAMMSFMPLYARARYVFITDSFIPVSACKKRKETTVIQLWHSSGLMKKIGYDSPQEADTVFEFQYRNYAVFTGASPMVGDVLSNAMRLPRETFVDTGVTLIDYNYREDLIAGFKKEFYSAYPEYEGKRIVLWAPTFRGTPREGYLVGQEEVWRLSQSLPDDYAVIIKTHRNSKMKEYDTEMEYRADMLIHVADVLITDYSSIYFDYLSKKLPIILFCPDLQKYREERGIYIDYESLPGKHVCDYDGLFNAVMEADSWADEAYRKRLDDVFKEHMSLCDGRSCEKLFKLIGLSE